MKQWAIASKKIHLKTNSSATEFTYDAINTDQKYEIYINGTLETTIKTDSDGTATFTIGQQNATLRIDIPESTESPYYGAIQSMGEIVAFALIVVVVRWMAKVIFPTAPTSKSNYR